MVETIPPLLGAGVRFIVVGLILLPFLAWRPRPARRSGRRARELLGAGFVGLMLPGANAVISVAEHDGAVRAWPRCWSPRSRCG